MRSSRVRHRHVPLFVRLARRPEAVWNMSRKKISTTIYITPAQSERLKTLHARTKVPVAVYIREGIDLVLQKHKDALPGQLTLDGTDG